MERYCKVRRLADALYGSIWLVECKASGQLLVVKEIELVSAKAKLTLRNQRKVHENVFVEFAVNKLLCSSSSGKTSVHIVQFIEGIQDNEYLYLVFEYCSGGELLTQLHDNEKWCQEKALVYFREIVDGLKGLHDNGFAHRDISLENVLLDDEDHVKLCDFGLATKAEVLANDSVGKRYYMAPEVACPGEQYDPIQADMWSLGVLLFILITGTPLMENAKKDDPRFQYLKENGITSLICYWKLTDRFPKVALELISKLIVVNPADRISIKDVVFLLSMKNNDQIPAARGVNKTIPSKSPTVAATMKHSFSSPKTIDSMFKCLSYRMNEKVLSEKTSLRI